MGQQEQNKIAITIGSGGAAMDIEPRNRSDDRRA